MNYSSRRKKHHAILISLILVVCFLWLSKPTSAVNASPVAGKSLPYAVKYRAQSGNQISDYLKLGYYDLKTDGTAKITYYFYDASKNRTPTASTKRHGDMIDKDGKRPPYYDPISKPCTPGPIQKPTDEGFSQFDGSWTEENNILKIRVGSVIHEWSLFDANANLYRLNRYYSAVDGSSTINGTVFSETEGFGYLTDQAVSTEKITRDQLYGSYFGEYYQNNALKTSPWWYKTSGLSVWVFTKVTNDVFSYSSPGFYYNAAGNKIDVYGEISLLMNEDDNKNLVYLNGGYDFNRNGCMDETGHSHKLLGVRESGMITKFVWIEYSRENDGYPIISVGRYYYQTAYPPMIQFLKPNKEETVTKGKPYTISWESKNISGDTKVGKISLWKGAVLIDDLTKNTGSLPASGSFIWTPASCLKNGPDYKIQILLYRNGKPVGTSLSTLLTITSTGVNPTCTPAPTARPSISPTPTGKKGDFNKDGKVDIFDYNILLSNFGKTSDTGDMNGDGKVDVFDYNMFVSGLGK